jgi:hypothetical protein
VNDFNQHTHKCGGCVCHCSHTPHCTGYLQQFVDPAQRGTPASI